MTLSIIVATDEENGIGKDNQLLWHLPKDLKFFKNTTSGHAIIMGRKTFESIGKPLPNRKNIVISRQKDLQITGVEVYQSLDDAIKSQKQEDELFIVGGGEIYKEAIHLADKLYITKVHHRFDADTFFPTIPLHEWKMLSKSEHFADEKHPYPFTFLTFERL